VSTITSRIPLLPSRPEGLGVIVATALFAVLVGAVCSIGLGIYAVGLVVAAAVAAYALAEPERSALAVLFLLPFMLTPLRVGDFYLSLTVPLGLLIGISLLLRSTGQPGFRLPRLYIGFALLLLVVTTIAALASTNATRGLSRAIYVAVFIVFGGGLGTALASGRLTERRVISVFVAGAAVAGVALTGQSLLQFVVGEARVQGWLRDLMPYFWGSSTGGLNWHANEVDLLRAVFPFMTPTWAGQYMAFGLVAALWLLLNRATPLSPARVNLTMLAIFVISSGLLLSFSRQSWIGAAAGVLVLLLRARRARLLALALPFTVLVMFLPMPGSSGAVFEYFASLPETKSSQDRLYLWGEALNISADHPLFGIGPGLYNDVRASVGPVYAHNAYLDQLVETGVAGGIIFTAYALTLLAAAWRRRATLALSLLVVWAFANFFDDAFYSPKMGLALAMAIALIAPHRGRQTDDTPDPAPPADSRARESPPPALVGV